MNVNTDAAQNCAAGMSETDDQLIARVTRWVNDVVIGLNLCPFAKAVFARQQIRYTIVRATSTDQVADALCDEMALLAKTDSTEIDTTLLIVRGALDHFEEFNDFLGVADALIEGLGFTGVFQIASFHPRYQFADTEANDVTNLTNRAPYPILHILREESVERAVDSFPDAATIYERNMETMRGLTAAQRATLGLA
jgi:uncharacterized protein